MSVFHLLTQYRNNKTISILLGGRNIIWTQSDLSAFLPVKICRKIIDERVKMAWVDSVKLMELVLGFKSPFKRSCKIHGTNGTMGLVNKDIHVQLDHSINQLALITSA